MTLFLGKQRKCVPFRGKIEFKGGGWEKMNDEVSSTTKDFIERKTLTSKHI